MTAHGGGGDGWRRLLHPFVLLPLLAVVVVGAWLIFFRSSGSDSASSATSTRQLVKVTQGSIQQTVSAQGTVAAHDTQSLSFTASGTVTAVDVVAGSTVAAGQVLATLDTVDLAAAVDQAQANLDQASAKLSDDTTAGASADQLAVDTANVTTAQDALASAQRKLAGATITAGLDGVVTSVNLVVGQKVGSTGGGAAGGSGAAPSGATTSSTAQITIATNGAFKVTLPIGSADISRIAVGQAATITSTSATTSTQQGRGGASGGATSSGSTTAATATGSVVSVGAVASASTGVATFPVVVAFRADPTQFFVGTSVIADIVTATLENVLKLPVRAITVAADGTSTVQSSVDESLTRTRTTTVVTGPVAGGMIEIRSGLNLGDAVVVTTTITTAGAGASGSGATTTIAGTGQRGTQRNGG